MKSEKDFKEGTTVIFTNADMTHKYTGITDYSEGAEHEGYIRIRQVFTETPDDGNIVLVPSGFIYGSN